MIKLIVLLLVCIKISAGYYEEYSRYNSFPSIDDLRRSNLPMPANYGEPQVRRRKPCPHRRSNGPDEEWVPSFRSMITKPLGNYALEPQSLKNELKNDVNVDTKTEKTESILNNESTTAGTDPDDTDSNKTDPDNTKNVLDGPSRRSFGGDLVNNDEPTIDEDYDCDLELGVEVQVSTLGPTPKSTVGVEEKVIEMLKDCLHKKQKYIEDKLTQDAPLAGSRRSMGNDNDNGVDLESVDSDNKELTTEGIENTTVELGPTDKTNNALNFSDRVFIPSSITLRPGKLYNELQNAAKASRIAKYPFSRRMLNNNTRTCFACSSATNPTCWEPDNRTTMKFCREDQNCITKSFGEKGSLTVIRDCAKTCDSSSVAGIEPKYNTCKVCYKDLCNSAAIYSYNLFIIVLITLKCAF